MEIPAQQAVAHVALVLHDPDHAPHRHTDQRQRVARQHQRGFERLRNHFRRACGLQLFEVAVVQRSNDHRHLWRVLARVAQHLERAVHVEVRDHHRAGASQACRHQRLQPRGVAVHHGVAGSGCLPDAIGVEVKREIGNAFALQHPGQVLAAAAIAADDDVLAGVDRLARDRGHLQRLLQPFARHHFQHDAVAVHDDERRGHHRQHHARQDRVEQRRRHQRILLPQRQQDKAELTGLRQVQAGAQRRAHRGAKNPGRHCHQQQLEQYRYGHQQQHQAPMLHEQAPIQQHADADEEQAEQHVVERADVGLHLVLELGFGNQHAGDERAQRQRQSRQLGEVGQRQRDQQQVQHEQLLAFAAGDDGQPPAHQPLAAGKQQRDQGRRLQRSNTERKQQLVRRASQCRDQDQQRHHGQVLEQQHAHHALAVLAFQLEPLGHQLDNDRSAAHRQCARQRQCGLPADAPECRRQDRQEQRAGGRQHNGQHHLAQAQPEYVPSHRAQLGQIEFQSDHEHQEHHAEFTEVAHAVGVVAQRQRVRTDDHADHQIAQHGRQFQRAASHDAQHRGQQVKQGELEAGHASMLACRLVGP